MNAPGNELPGIIDQYIDRYAQADHPPPELLRLLRLAQIECPGLER